MIQRNDLCWCGSGKKWKKCHFPDPGNVGKNHSLGDLRKLYFQKYGIFIKNDQQIEGIRKACHLASQILDATCEKAKEGITTLELNDFAHQLHLDAGAIPAPLHYGAPPFPKSICTSLNDMICHGIPNEIPLQEGDILNVDVTAILNGFYGDCSRMVTIGNISSESQLVVDVSYECLMRAIAPLKRGVPLSQVGKEIESYATEHHCSVVNQFVGHGVGIEFHEPPQVLHYRNALNIPLAPGMIFTIEPMINAGVREAIIDPRNHWEARTKDGKMSAQWEHTILITDTGYEILTTWKR